MMYTTILKMLVTAITIKTVAPAISWDSACGSTKGCFPDCTGGCEYLVTWQDSGTNIVFELKAEETDTNAYLAIGFSGDRKMGDDSVVGCIIPGATVYSYHNEGTDTDELSPNTLGLTSTSVSQVNGVITCTFTRSYDETTDDKFFNLNNKYILLLVVGEAEQEHGAYELGDHVKIPWSSDDKVDFTSHDVVGLYKLNSLAVKLHGIMMVLAWLLLVIVGIVTARYNKEMLPEQKLFGTKVWFQVHRGLMVTAVVFVVIGLVLIVVEIEGYSQIVSPSSTEVVQAHPILGIIVTVLCFINPIMGILRPGGDHKFRWIFNWAHLGVGVFAQFLAIVTIFLGYLLERSMLPSSVIYVTIVHLVVVAAISIALEVNKWMTIRNKKHQVDDTGTIVPNGIELEEKDVEAKKEVSTPSTLPFILLLVLGGFLFVICIALLVIIAAN